jgi:hypothetical protein
LDRAFFNYEENNQQNALIVSLINLDINKLIKETISVFCWLFSSYIHPVLEEFGFGVSMHTETKFRFFIKW